MIPWWKGKKNGKPERAKSDGFALTQADKQISALPGTNLTGSPWVLTRESRNPCISPPQGPDRLVSVPFARPWVLQGRGTSPPTMRLTVPRAWHREGTLIKVVLN